MDIKSLQKIIRDIIKEEFKKIQKRHLKKESSSDYNISLLGDLEKAAYKYFFEDKKLEDFLSIEYIKKRFAEGGEITQEVIDDNDDLIIYELKDELEYYFHNEVLGVLLDKKSFSKDFNLPKFVEDIEKNINFGSISEVIFEKFVEENGLV